MNSDWSLDLVNNYSCESKLQGQAACSLAALGKILKSWPVQTSTAVCQGNMHCPPMDTCNCVAM
jgi:hypothetical protein